MKNVPVLNKIFCHEKMLDYAHSDVSKTAKILSVSATELMLQKKPRKKSNQEVPHFFKPPHGNDSLYGCEWATNELRLSVASPRCRQHCDVFVGISLED